MTTPATERQDRRTSRFICGLIAGLICFLHLGLICRAEVRVDPRLIADLQSKGETRAIVTIARVLGGERAEEVLLGLGLKRVAGIDSDTAVVVLGSPVDLAKLSGAGQVKLAIADALIAGPLSSKAAQQTTALPVWELGQDGKGTAIAFIDTGLDVEHPMLKDKVVAQACFLLGDADSRCPQGATRLATGEEIDFSETAAVCPEQECSHGTHTAGLTAGRANAGAEAVGIAKGADIVAIRALGGSGVGAISSILRALTWILSVVYEHRSIGVGPNIIAVNMSFGVGLYSASCAEEPQFILLARRIRELREENVAVFAAAGNHASSDELPFPACVSETVTVAALDENNRVSTFSNYSPDRIDIATFGEKLRSASPRGGYVALSGTSMAAAIASGAYAVLKSAFPGTTVNEIETALKVTGTPVQFAKPVTHTFNAINLSAAYDFLRQLSREMTEDELRLQRNRIDR